MAGFFAWVCYKYMNIDIFILSCIEKHWLSALVSSSFTVHFSDFFLNTEKH